MARLQTVGARIMASIIPYAPEFRLDDYTPVTRLADDNKWTADRQRRFIAGLAETRCL